MLADRFTSSLKIGMLACLVASIPASAAFVQIPQPNAGYTSSTTLIPITNPPYPDLTILNSIADPNLTINFSTGLEARTVPPTWATWNVPPAVETSTPRVLKTPGLGNTLLTLSFSKPLTIFGLEAEPDPNLNSPTFLVTENFFNGATNVGSISMNVNGNGGALLFAGQATAPTSPFTSVNITAGATDFAIAQLRYQLAPAPPLGTPEPATWMAMAGGLFALAGFRKFARR